MTKRIGLKFFTSLVPSSTKAGLLPEAAFSPQVSLWVAETLQGSPR